MAIIINIPVDISREDLEFDYDCGISEEDFNKLTMEEWCEALKIISDFTDLFLFILRNRENINEAIITDFIDFEDRVREIKKRMDVYKFTMLKPRWFVEVFEQVDAD